MLVVNRHVLKKACCCPSLLVDVGCGIVDNDQLLVGSFLFKMADPNYGLGSLKNITF